MINPLAATATTAEAMGCSPDATGLENAAALQKALDVGGTVTLTEPGIYRIAATVLIKSDTRLIFGHGVRLQKVDEAGPFCHVLLNRGALTRTFDERITIENLFLKVNSVDLREKQVPGLRGQIALFYVRDARIIGFRCVDLSTWQFAIHVCTFEDLIIEDAIIKGEKDGVHLGRGRRFRISRCVFQTNDDAVALNAQDYATSNPELGWIEQGIVEGCTDLAQGNKRTGFFCRILAGGWGDWSAGMEVQHSDTVVHAGGVYRVYAEPDGRTYCSQTPPQHERGLEVIDGIPWQMVQPEAIYTAGVRHVTFRDITLEKPRRSFSIHFDHNEYNRSYYPGGVVPVQQSLHFEHVRILHDEPLPAVIISSPFDQLTLRDCTLGPQGIEIQDKVPVPLSTPSTIQLIGCTFSHPAEQVLMINRRPNAPVRLKTFHSITTQPNFSASVETPDHAETTLDSDLPGLA